MVMIPEAVTLPPPLFLLSSVLMKHNMSPPRGHVLTRHVLNQRCFWIGLSRSPHRGAVLCEGFSVCNALMYQVVSFSVASIARTLQIVSTHTPAVCVHQACIGVGGHMSSGALHDAPLCALPVFPAEPYNDTSTYNSTDPYGGESLPVWTASASCPSVLSLRITVINPPCALSLSSHAPLSIMWMKVKEH